MPVKRGQKQKQKQSQKVIVHIHDKPKRRTTKRKPTTAKPKKGTTTHFQPPISYSPLGVYASGYNMPSPKVNNNDVANLIKKLSEDQASSNASIRRAILSRTADPQHEIVQDVRDVEALPDRPSKVHSLNDIRIARLKAQASAKNPFVFEEEVAVDEPHKKANS